MKNKNIVILGGGESGTGSAILAKKHGFNVFVSDMGKIKEKYKSALKENNIDFEEEQHSKEIIFKANEIIKSPGIPDNVAVIKEAKSKNINIISEIEFAGRYTNAKIICITGSNGKTTTASLIYHICKNAGLNVGLGGNIGKSFAWQVADKNYDYYILEISSFQLDGMYEFKADIAVLMNITPDHLDRYDNDFQKYIDSKFRIIQNQDENDSFIYCADDELIKKEIIKRNIKSKLHPFSLESSEIKEGAYLIENKICITIKSIILTMTIENLALQGKHNIYNSMASGITARILEIRKSSIKESLSDFQNIEHRLEFVNTVHGIEFINDSKATNVNSTWYALESMTNPVIWIVGGIDKGNDYKILKELVKEKVKLIVCLGIDNEKIHKAFGEFVDDIYDTNSASQAVRTAYQLGKQGDTVLLSPACASFDLFKNYEERGGKFKEAVKSL